MSDASIPAEQRAQPWSERLQSWIGAVLSLLLHLLMLLVLLHSNPPTVETSQGAPAGGRMRVDFIGDSTAPADTAPPSPPPSRAKTPPTPRPAKPRVARTPPAASRLQTTRTDRSDNPLLVQQDAPPSTATSEQAPTPEQPREAPQPSQTPPSNPSPTGRRSPTWGHPPGYIAQDSAPVNAGWDDSPAVRQGSGRDTGDSGPSLQVGGYHAIYETRSEDRVRAWMAQGMKEFAIPLPGTEYLMVCPLDIVLKHGSGACRALPPDSPELADIGESRQIINMLRVYHHGDLVWKGPGPYR